MPGRIPDIMRRMDCDACAAGNCGGCPGTSCDCFERTCRAAQEADRGLVYCRRCRHCFPEGGMVPVVTWWRRSWWHRKVKITHWTCSEECRASILDA